MSILYISIFCNLDCLLLMSLRHNSKGFTNDTLYLMQFKVYENKVKLDLKYLALKMICQKDVSEEEGKKHKYFSKSFSLI